MTIHTKYRIFECVCFVLDIHTRYKHHSFNTYAPARIVTEEAVILVRFRENRHLGPIQGRVSTGVRFQDVLTEFQARVSTGRLNVTCVQCENGKSISPIDSAQPTMARGADTDSDLARPPDGKHPSAWNATPAMLLRSATRSTAGHVVAHPDPCDSE